MIDYTLAPANPRAEYKGRRDAGAEPNRSAYLPSQEGCPMPRLAFEPERIAVGMAFACINGQSSLTTSRLAGPHGHIFCSGLLLRAEDEMKGD